MNFVIICGHSSIFAFSSFVFLVTSFLAFSFYIRWLLYLTFSLMRMVVPRSCDSLREIASFLWSNDFPSRQDEHDFLLRRKIEYSLSMCPFPCSNIEHFCLVCFKPINKMINRKFESISDWQLSSPGIKYHCRCHHSQRRSQRTSLNTQPICLRNLWTSSQQTKNNREMFNKLHIHKKST